MAVMRPSALIESMPCDDNSSRCTRRDLEHNFAASLPPHPWLTMTLKWISWEILPNPPVEVRSGLQKKPRRLNHAQLDRRRDERTTFNEKAVALALTDDFKPVGNPFKVFIREMSTNGIDLVHTERLANQLIAVSWRGLRRNRIVTPGPAELERQGTDRLVARPFPCSPRPSTCSSIPAVVVHSDVGQLIDARRAETVWTQNKAYVHNRFGWGCAARRWVSRNINGDGRDELIIGDQRQK